MKNLFKRISAGLLALFMVLSLLVGIIPADTFAASYTYNTGTRHDYNTELSDQAEAYYTGEYTWEKLSVLQGSNGSCTDMSTPMFKALSKLMSSTMTNSVSYSSLPNYWKYTDASGGSNTYILFYKDVMGPDSSMNREHVWPNSHGTFDKTNGGCDLHHLRPTNGGYNSSRGNLIMGNVRGVYSSYSKYPTSGDPAFYKTSSIVEVNDNIKGDVARILLYVWCRWEEPNLFTNTGSTSGSDGGKVIESLDTLLQWCALDPVDTWEMSRNDQVQNIQGNRNVFIDYPEFAWLLFGRDVPEGITTPSDNDGVSANPGGSNSGNNGGSSSTPDTSYTQVSSLKDGDKVLIVNPASNMALSTTKVATYYNAGVDISGGFSSISNSEIFTAKKNSDGSWSFTSADGKKIALADSYNSLNDTGANDKWELSSAGTNQFYLKNIARDLYLEWYADKGNWSTHTTDPLNQDYVLAFYTKATTSSGGSSSGGSTGGSTGSSTGGSTTTTKPATQPTTTKPATQPTTTKPATQPTTTKPATQPTTTKPATQPTTTKPATQPATQATQPSTTPSTDASNPVIGTQPSSTGSTGPQPLATNSVPVPTLNKGNQNSNSNSWILIVILVAIALIGGGVAVYFFVIRPKFAAPVAESESEEVLSEETPDEPSEETPDEPSEEISDSNE